jgi:5'-3' exonuclease
MSIALIDADIVAYRCAASAEHEGEEIALLRVEGMMQEILSKHEEYKAFLTGPNNFRYKIYPAYKANRVNKDKPLYLKDCQDYLVSEYKAVVSDGCEADDLLGINQTEDSVIYSIDKDLLMIPGHHFNFVTGIYKEISELDGLKQFYRQMLIGDTADNVKGVDGIGKVKATKLIDHLETEEEMSEVVYLLYDTPERFAVNADLLWIWRHNGETYTKRMDRGTEEILYNIGLARGITPLACQVPVFSPSLCGDNYQQEEWEIGETLPLQPL